MSDDALRLDICRAGETLVRRGLVHGTTGNISIRTSTGMLLTPTGKALDRLDPSTLCELSADGEHIGGAAPTKEFRLHRAVYAARPAATAVVHTHSTHSVAVSLLDSVNDADMLPALTPYYVMRVGKCAVAPYRIPGDARLAVDVGELALRHHVIMLARHGPVVAGPSLDDAIATLEELEETARLYLLVRGSNYRELDAQAVAEIDAKFPLP